MLSIQTPRAVCGILGAFLLALTPLGAGSASASSRTDDPPFPAALEKAGISQERLDHLLDRSLIIGNGDINALVSTRGQNLVLRLTKNDVWDARLDTTNDPPLLTIDIRAQTKSASDGSVSSWAKPYPCPILCGEVWIGDAAVQESASWDPIRTEGRTNTWELVNGVATMAIEGGAKASCGYACALPPLEKDAKLPSVLRVRLAGSSNARFFLEIPGNPQLGTGWLDSPPELQERVFPLPVGLRPERLMIYTMTTDGRRAENRFASVALAGPAGTNSLSLPSSNCVGATASKLDIRRAVARVEGAAGGVPRAEVRALAQANVFLIESSAPVRLVRHTAPWLPRSEAGESGTAHWLKQEVPGDLDWPGMTYAVALVTEGRETAVALVTSHESRDVVAAAVRLAQKTAKQNAENLIAAHVRGWAEFWSASGIEIDDPLLQAAWYRNLYFLRCVSKPGVEAVGLFAGLVSDAAAWHGGHTINYNTQQAFWSAYAANHTELSEPLERFVVRYLPRARWLARRTYDCEGAFFPHNLYPNEPPEPDKCRSNNHRAHAFSPWAYTIGNSGLLAQNLWWRYQFQPERAYLRNVAYPVVRDVAAFYADFASRCPVDGRGRILLGPSVSPEHWGWTKNFDRNRNVTFDLAYVRFIFAAFGEASAILGRDRDLAARCRELLPRLADYPLSADPEPVVVDVDGAPPIEYNIAVPAVPVFPAGVVTWLSPEAEKRVFARTIERLKWNGNNSSIMLPVARARLSMPGACEYLKTELQARSRPNGTITLNRLGGGFNDFGHYTEQFAASMAISELLLQSVNNILRIFPAWPSAQNAQFHHLRTQGGFLVSAVQRDGKVIQLDVTSTAGGELRLLSPWPVVQANGKTLRPDTLGIISLSTRAGGSYSFAPNH